MKNLFESVGEKLVMNALKMACLSALISVSGCKGQFDEPTKQERQVPAGKRSTQGDRHMTEMASGLFSAVSKDGSRKACFLVSKRLIPVATEDGFVFVYDNIEFLTGETIEAGQVGRYRSSSTVTVTMENDKKQFDDASVRMEALGYETTEDPRYYRMMPKKLGPMSSIYSTHKETLVSVRILTSKFQEDQIEEAVREARVVDKYLEAVMRPYDACLEAREK
jgi:hypothetical protein